MKLFSYAALCAVAIFIAACSKDDDSPVTPANSAASDYWMPTAAGTRSVLEGTSVTSMNGVTTDSTVDNWQFLMTGGSKTTLDGKAGRTLQNITVSGPSVDTSLSYIVLSTDALMVYDDSLTAATANVVLKTPLSVGTSWLTRGTDTTHSSIASVSETVVTPAGTFSNCIRVRVVGTYFGNGSTTQDLYLAKGVGLVRSLGQATYTLGGSTYNSKSDMKLKSKSF